MRIALYLFCIILPLLFLCDISIFALVEHAYAHTVLALFIVQLFAPIDSMRIFFAAFVLALESFIFYGQAGLTLIYLAPIGWLALMLRNMLYGSRLYPVLLYAACLSIQVIGIEWYLLGIPMDPWYTTAEFIANIVVLLGLSLIYTAQGKQGNRM